MPQDDRQQQWLTNDAGAEAAGRKYHGLIPQERIRQRRAALLAAALQVFATQGYANSSIKRICGVAGLTERYFYESFTDRESCLAALYSHLIDQTRAATLAALASADTSAPESTHADVDAQARAGLHAFIGSLTDDPRRARVVLVEVVGVSPAMEERRHGVLREFADLVASTWGAARAEPLTPTQRSTAVALVGGVNHLLVDWLMTGSGQRPTDLAEICATLFSAARERLEAETEVRICP